MSRGVGAHGIVAVSLGAGGKGGCFESEENIVSGNLTVFARLALAASSTSLSLLTSAPAHAAEDVTPTDVTGTYATDGSGDRNAAPIPVELVVPVATVDAMPPCLRTTPVGAEGCDQGTLKGAYEAVSALSLIHI